MADCLVCEEIDGTIPLPGGLLAEERSVVAFHVPPLERNPRPYLGHLLVVSRRHVARLGDLSDEESGDVGRVAARLARQLTENVAAEWVYSAVIGTGVPHFHLHLLPRYPGTPRDVPWHSLDEWQDGPHGSAMEIADFVSRLNR
jgi:diadenosine tetraphosphate (Ap4A) HIT family hydrolase